MLHASAVAFQEVALTRSGLQHSFAELCSLQLLGQSFQAVSTTPELSVLPLRTVNLGNSLEESPFEAG